MSLTACGSDAMEDVNQPNNPSTASNTNSGGNGGMTTFSHAGEYQSFWDITQHWEMFYHYRNHTGDWGNPAMLNFRVTPYVGLAYYDIDNDGEYKDPFNTVVDFNIQPPGTYPNIFDPTKNEIGNFVPARPFTLTGAGIPSYWGTVRLEVFSADHCHLIGANVFAGGTNPNGVFFDIAAPPAPYQPSTPQEQSLLSKFGKVFFYRWEAVNPATMAVVRSGYIMPECDTNMATYWKDTTVTANLPVGGVANLYYNILSNDTGNPSYEVVLEHGTYPSEDTFSYTVGGQTYNYTVSLQTFLGGTGNPVSELKLTYN